MQDLRMIFGYGKPYRKDLFAAVGLIFVECIFEMVIPVLMSTLVDDGVPDHNMAVIFRQGGLMILCAVLALITGLLYARYAARFANGFAAELRMAEYAAVQKFDFANLDRFSDASLVTRMTTDVTVMLNAVNTGLRLGELLGLQWKDVNKKEHCIHIRRTLGRLQKVDEKGRLVQKSAGVTSTEIVVRSPKSDLSKRKIPLFDELWKDLMAYKEKQDALKDTLGKAYHDEDYVFATPLGAACDPKVYQTLFKRVVADAGIEPTNFHALRHTFATRALESGMDIKVLSTILGHAQASTTLNLYAHALPDHKKDSMEKMRGHYKSCIGTDNCSVDTNAEAS